MTKLSFGINNCNNAASFSTSVNTHSPYVVTGVTGYIGRHLCNRLVEMGAEVHALVRSLKSPRTDVPDGVVVWPWTGAFSDVASLFREIGSRNPVVVHLAAQTTLNYPHKDEELNSLVEANFTLGLCLLEAAGTFGCKKLINTGSYWQYSQGPLPCSNSIYAATKNAFDQLVNYYVLQRKFVVITLVLTDVYGPNDLPGKVLNQLIRHDQMDQDFEVTFGGQKLNFVHIDDVVDAYVLSAQDGFDLRPGVHNQYFVANQESIELKETLRLSLNLCNCLSTT